jgi:hypothetical protein
MTEGTIDRVEGCRPLTLSMFLDLFASLLGPLYETLSAFSSAHDGLHERKEAVGIFRWRNWADFVL